MKRVIVAALCALAALPAGAQTTLSEFRTQAERVLLVRVMRAEDNRARSADDLAILREGVAASNAALRRVAVRAFGRLEREEALANIAPLLGDRDARVRAAAAEAMAQAAVHGGAPTARAALVARIDAERDPMVIAALAESMGRLQPANGPEAASTVAMLERLSRQPNGDAPAATLRGVVRGFFFLTRRLDARSAIPASTIDRLRELAGYGRAARGRAATEAAYIRQVAAAALVGSGGSTQADVASILSDTDEWVRAQAVARITPANDPAGRGLLMRALADPAPIVRFRAVPLYARALRGREGCAPLVEAARDTNTHVALVAIDALGSCQNDAAARALLDSLASRVGRLPSQWHRPTHAVLALATLAPDAARAYLPSLVTSPDFFVRTYGARIARQIGDASTLVRLADRDANANVRSEAVDGLAALAGHDYDMIYVRALEANESQLLQSAARALRGGKLPAAPAALLAALDRVTALRRETSRDARVALLATIHTGVDSSQAGRLRPYLRDFDPVVADSAASILAAWTGTRPAVAVATLPPVPLPPASALADLLDPRATIEMADGSKVALRLFPLDAPSNAWRFVRLARAGYFNGLTFHRVVPYFVVQGGSPGANEYVGDGPFTRDEVGIENQRGTIGVSTRGRDTGDGQIYFNTVDNVRLDHDYTVFAVVTSGMDVVDRMQEGARIRAVTIR